MLQARFGQASVAGLAQAERTYGLREGAFDPLTPRVEAPALCRALSCPGGRQGILLVLRQKPERPALVRGL